MTMPAADAISREPTLHSYRQINHMKPGAQVVDLLHSFRLAVSAPVIEIPIHMTRQAYYFRQAMYQV